MGQVLRGARETLGDRSPELVARSAGVSGRTIRRLEDGEYDSRPRALTLDALASFYGLRAGFLRKLGTWTDLPAEEVAPRLHEAAREVLGDEAFEEEDDDLSVLAMRVARATTTHRESPWTRKSDVVAGDDAQGLFLEPGGRDADAIALMRDFLRLDRRRQRMLLDLVAELRHARDAERDN